MGKEQTLGLEKRILLQLIDQNWKSHIQYLEQLRGVIGLRSYGNRDPLIEYKKEAFSLFENLLNKLKTDLITVLLNLKIVEQVKQSENEISSILDLNEENFEKEIKNKFFKKRSERENILGKDKAQEIEKRILLQLIDQNWKSHIQYLEQLRGVVGLRSYGQRDPLVEYKKEAYSLFENLLFKLKSDLITVLLNLEVVQENQEPINNNSSNDISFKKIGRNEPCPCNSGKKYKHCHGSL